jgi:hypothetical protein
MSEDNSKELAIKKKCQKAHPDFVSVVDNMQLEELGKKQLEYANYREQTELAKKKDEALQAAKDQAAELARPYNEALKALKEKMAYMNLLIDERKQD